jgi:hypothetical protein
MPGPEYESIRLNSRSSPSQEGRLSLDASSEGGSDVSYRDNLDAEPFDEKASGDVRFRDEPTMEEGQEGFSMQPQRVCLPV